MQRKIAIRFILGVLAICALILGSGFMKEFFKDPGKREVDTAGLVLAIENLPKGQQAVYFKPNGEKVASAGYKEGNQDQGVSWAPDGNRAYISSNRDANSFNIYVWDTDANTVEQRSTGSRSQGVPWYGPLKTKGLDRSGMILSGGFVMEYDVTDQTTHQILPPVDRNRRRGDEGGAGSTMEALYGQIGTSFKQAFWAKDRTTIYAVMRKDEEEVAVFNPLTDGPDGKPRVPRRILGGKAVQMDANGQGVIAFVIRNFQFGSPGEAADFFQATKRRVPFTTAIFKIDGEINGMPDLIPVITVEGPQATFMDPAISPDGSKLAVVAGEPSKDGAGMKPRGLFVMPFEKGGGTSPTMLAPGDISQPSWSPDGKKIVFVRREGTQGAIYTINADGSDPRKLSSSGDFTSPKFSPKLPKSSS